MMRSLYSGVAGLKTHQTKMDVIGNNVANVNTTAYKKDRVEFKDNTYYIKGRVGDVIIGDNGENINPDIIEQQFSLPMAENYAVLGIENNGKECVTLVVQISKYMSDQKKNMLIDTIHKTNSALPITSRVQKIYYTTDAIKSESAVKVSRKWLINAISESKVTLNDYIPTAENSSEEEYNPELYATVIKIISDILSINPDEIKTIMEARGI